jgi:catechol 2,3-dioxygenase-like lactoylglutathione lyase family enzyme
MNLPRRVIHGLGEIALRVNDLDTMQKFYAEVVGLALLRRFEHAAFFRIAEGYGGHTQVLALFDRSAEPGYAGLSPDKTTVDHRAFEIGLADFEAEKSRLGQRGLAVRTTEHAWVGWRSLYFDDPEGHTVELVCYDPAVR